jgi:hypothetical protein
MCAGHLQMRVISLRTLGYGHSALGNPDYCLKVLLASSLTVDLEAIEVFSRIYRVAHGRRSVRRAVLNNLRVTPASQMLLPRKSML